MEKGSFMRAAFPAVIEATEDPIGPIKLQSAHGAINSVARMLAKMKGVSKEKTDQYLKRFMATFPEEEMTKISAEPELIICLAGMLMTSMEDFVINATEKGSKK